MISVVDVVLFVNVKVDLDVIVDKAWNKIKITAHLKPPHHTQTSQNYHHTTTLSFHNTTTPRPTQHHHIPTLHTNKPTHRYTMTQPHFTPPNHQTTTPLHCTPLHYTPVHYTLPTYLGIQQLVSLVSLLPLPQRQHMVVRLIHHCQKAASSLAY